MVDLKTVPDTDSTDSEEDARVFIEKNYSDTFMPDFDFSRTGWQYNLLNGDQVDLEDIEGRFSIEFKSKTEEGLKSLLKVFKVSTEEVIQGPSVIAIKKLLKI